MTYPPYCNSDKKGNFCSVIYRNVKVDMNINFISCLVKYPTLVYGRIGRVWWRTDRIWWRTWMDGWMDLGWSRSTHLSLRYLWAQVRKSSSNSKESDRTLSWVHVQQDIEHALLWGENLNCRVNKMYEWTSKRRELDHYPAGWRHT